MNILVTLDRNYLEPLRVMLGSLFLNNPHETFDVYMIGDGLLPEDIQGLFKLCDGWGNTLHPLTVPEELFDDAPTVRYYTKAMYYRLLAADLLPRHVDRVLYVDPDILVIGKVRPLYETDISGHLFAAATHSGHIGMTDYVNKVRLDNYDAQGYFNSGVLLMNLAAMRREVQAKDIFDYARTHEEALLLPDQDILNGLYGARILAVSDSIWNYDARRYEKYWFTSQGERDMDWVMEHTVLLHFCGKNKPWHKNYIGHFSALYKHYRQLLQRLDQARTESQNK